jgi:predicted transcriptional regulator of viral defense system
MAKPLQKIMRYVGQHGIVRPRDIEAIGLPREYLVRLHRQGRLSRPGRGIYTLPDANVTERHSYAEVAKRVPRRPQTQPASSYWSPAVGCRTHEER